MKIFNKVITLDGNGNVPMDSYMDRILLDNSIIYFCNGIVKHYYIMYNNKGRMYKERLRGNNTKSKMIDKKYEPLIQLLRNTHKDRYHKFMDSNGYLNVGRRRAKNNGGDYYHNMFNHFKRAKLHIEKGEKIHNLKFIEFTEPITWLSNTRKVNVTCAKFKCDCGNVTIKPVSQVYNGNVKSCGCVLKKNRKNYYKAIKK